MTQHVLRTSDIEWCLVERDEVLYVMRDGQPTDYSVSTSDDGFSVVRRNPAWPRARLVGVWLKTHADVLKVCIKDNSRD